jgi:hypothetical protein
MKMCTVCCKTGGQVEKGKEKLHFVQGLWIRFCALKLLQDLLNHSYFLPANEIRSCKKYYAV